MLLTPAESEALLLSLRISAVAVLGALPFAFLAALLLARVDGKSPVEYLPAAADKEFVRKTARDFIAREETSLDAMTRDWSAKLKASKL